MVQQKKWLSVAGLGALALVYLFNKKRFVVLSFLLTRTVTAEGKVSVEYYRKE
jgi:hypothetical protein